MGRPLPDSRQRAPADPKRAVANGGHGVVHSVSTRSPAAKAHATSALDGDRAPSFAEPVPLPGLPGIKRH